MPGVSLKKTVRDISSLKINGSESVSAEALKSLKEEAHKSRAKTPEAFVSDMKKARELLESARPGDPYFTNALNSAFLTAKGANLRELKEALFSSIQKTIAEIKHNRSMVVNIGAQKIKQGMAVFTHSYSSTVIETLKEAKKRGKRFVVHNTETRPLMQGREAAKELAEAGIKVRHYTDSAARQALKKADLMMIGAVAVASDGRIINGVGSELFSEIARRYDIPVYVCADSWKFDSETVFGAEEEVEAGSADDVWQNPPKNVEIDIHAFEAVDPELVTGVITDLGIFEPRVLVEEIRRAYPWMIKK